MASKMVCLRVKLLKKRLKAMQNQPINRLIIGVQELRQRVDQIRQLAIPGLTDADFNELTLLLNGITTRVTARMAALGLQSLEAQVLVPFVANTLAATQLMYSTELEVIFDRISGSLNRVDGQTLGESLVRIGETQVWTSLVDPKSDSGRGSSDASTSPTSDSN